MHLSMIYDTFNSVATWGETKFQSLLSLPGSILKKIFEVAGSIFSFLGSKKKPVDADKEPLSLKPVVGVPKEVPLLAPNLQGQGEVDPKEQGEVDLKASDEIPPLTPLESAVDPSVCQTERAGVESLATLCISNPGEKFELLNVIDGFSRDNNVKKDELICFAIVTLLEGSPEPAVNLNPGVLACDLVNHLTIDANKKAQLEAIMVFYVKHYFIEGRDRVAAALRDQPEPKKNNLIHVFLKHKQFDEYCEAGLNSEENMLEACKFDKACIPKLLSYMTDASILELVRFRSSEFEGAKNCLVQKDMNAAVNAINSLIDFDIGEERQKRLVSAIRDTLAETLEEASKQAFINRWNLRFQIA